MARKCRLCGGKLSPDNRCTFCGLDNTVYERDEAHIQEQNRRTGQKKSASTAPSETSGSSPKPAAASGRKKSSPTAAAPRDSGRKTSSAGKTSRQRRIALLFILIIFLVAILPSLFRVLASIPENLSFFSDTSSYDDDYDYDPYEYVTREIPENGENFGIILGSGCYQVGAHIPEGSYTVELAAGTGALHLEDPENIIYEYLYFGDDEEYDEITEASGLLLYNGAEITVDSGVVLKLATSNAQPLIYTATSNPVTESVVVSEGSVTIGSGSDPIPEGIYNICPSAANNSEYASVHVIYPNEYSSSFWIEHILYEGDITSYEENGAQNIILPAGTQLEVSGDPVELVPSDPCYDIDFENYPKS